MKKKVFVSINGQTIRKNAKEGTNLPPIRIAKSKSDKKPVYARGIRFNGPVELTYTPECRQLSCGARLVMIGNYDDLEIVA